MKRKTIAVIALVLCISAAAWAEEYDALIRDAYLKLADKEYGEALQIYAKAFESGEGHYSDYYNAACAAALTDDPDGAFTYLDKAVEGGLIEKEWLESDPDLEGLRSDGRWKKLLAAIDRKLEALALSFPEAHAEENVIDLPEPRFESEISIEETLKNRRSIRSYEETPLTLAEISQLLWSAYGITEPREDAPAFLRGGLRAAPSAGALYPLELYVAVRKVTGLSPGVYWYKSETHQLVVISQEDRWEAVSEAGFNQSHFGTAAAAIVYSAIFERNTDKYGKRGRERYVCMDLGHSAENVYLQAYALKIGTCAIGAFSDMALKSAIGMTREEEPLYIMPLGKVR
jgi:SagB-type dehydrogenase family enzyme